MPDPVPPPVHVHTVYLVLKVEEEPSLTVTVLFASLSSDAAIEEYNKVAGQVGVSLTKATYTI